MRQKLRSIENKRKQFIAQFIRYGSKYNNQLYYDTILIRKVTELSSLKIVAQHLWINCDNKFLQETELHDGDYIIFDATVKLYEKGYKGKRIDLIINNPKKIDYKLSNISNIKVINEKEIL